MRTTKHLPLKRVLEKRMKDPTFRFYFEESRSISELCHKITQSRQIRKMSQTELAQKTGTTQSVIARLENGNQGRMPRLDLLNRIAHALDLNLVVSFEKPKAA